MKILVKGHWVAGSQRQPGRLKNQYANNHPEKGIGADEGEGL